MSGFDDQILPPSTHHNQRQLIFRFAFLGAAMGLLVGLGEAAILYFIPRVPTLDGSELGCEVWVITPLIDFCLFLLIGTILGCIAVILRPSARKTAVLMGTLVGLAGAFLAWSRALIHVWPADLEALMDFKV